jgi:riboflavin biosynthesis pyrimidine reductase
MSDLVLNRLRPGPCEEVDAASAYAYPGGGQHHLRVNMVSSVDGAATLDGRVGTLTGPADQRLLVLLRALADVLIVGAGTIRAEGYGPLTVGADLAPLREQAGLSPAPRLVVPTRSLDLDLDGAAFTEALEPPMVVTTRRAPADRVRAAESVAEVVVLGDDVVDLTAMVDLLAERGARRMLCEGGPGLLAGLLAEDLVDELCLAVAPVVTCGAESRITAGPALASPRHLSLTQVAERDDFLFLRYARGDRSAGS